MTDEELVKVLKEAKAPEEATFEKIGRAVVGLGVLGFVLFELVTGLGLADAPKNGSHGTVRLDPLTAQKIDSLYEWHNRMDPDGLPVWYMPRSLSQTLEKQTKVLEKQTLAIERLVVRIESMNDELRSMRRGG